MQGFGTIISSIVYLAIIIGIGFVSFKTGYMTQDAKATLSKVVVRITLPLLVINTLTKLTITPELMKNAIFIVITSFVCISVLYIIGVLIGKLFKLEKATAVVHSIMMAFGNVVFLGYPLIQALYGETGLFYAACYAFVNDALVWTFAVYQLAKYGNNSVDKLPWQKCISPPTVSFAIAIVMMIFGLKVTGVLARVFDSVGSMTTPISMLFIGATLASVDLKSILKRLAIMPAFLIKMLVVPALLTMILVHIPVDPVAKCVVAFQIAMPSQTIMAIISQEYKADTTYAAAVIFTTTLLSMATLPLMYMIINYFCA